MRRLCLVTGLVLLAGAVWLTADETAVVDPAAAVGIRLDVEIDPLDPTLARVAVDWLRPSAEARVRVVGDVEVVSSTFPGGDRSTASEWESAPLAVADGDGGGLLLAIRPGAAGRPLAVLAERTDGEVVFQTTVTLGFDGVTTRTMSRTDVRIRRLEHEGGGGLVTIEKLSSTPAPKGVVDASDATNRPIADGPTDCSSASIVWPLTTFLGVSSAPSGATTTAVTVHLDVEHPMMADLQIVMSKEFATVARYLWNRNPGANLDQSFTTDVSGQPLPGIGEPTNGTWVLAARDCLAGSTGFLDRWSLAIEYDAVPTIDLVADSVSTSATSVAAGGSFQIAYAGHATGSGTIGVPFSLGFYLSDDAKKIATDVLLAQRLGSWATTGGDSFSASAFTVIVPSSTPAGTYLLIFWVDDTNVVTEPNESNNRTFHLSVVVTNGGGTQPNLVAMPCSVEPVISTPGGNITVSWRAFNLGDAGTGPFNLGIYLSEDGYIEPGVDTALRVEPQTEWPAGTDSSQRNSVLTLPNGLDEGLYFVGLALDTANAVAESDENDNTCWTQLQVGSNVVIPAFVTRWLVPAAASAPGFGTSNWKTQISVVNPLNDTRSASLYFVANGAPWPGVLLSGPITISPTNRVFFDDVLASLNPVAGLLYVVLDQAGPVASSRTYNLESGGATFGQGIPAIPFEGIAAPETVVLPLVHTDPGKFHTNLGIVHAASGNLQVQVQVFNAAGSMIGTKNYSQSAAWRQINDLFDDMGLGSQVLYGGWLRVTRTSGSGFWTCYASVVDDRTNDPTYVAPVEVVY
jgi:subtilisin-like proprotein convertase family protein